MARRGLESSEGVSVMPVMNLMTLLIPFVLLSTKFMEISVVDAALPAQEAPVGHGARHGVLLVVHVGHQGFEVREGDERPAVVPCLGADCDLPERFDAEGLSALLAGIKVRWPEQQEIVIEPEPWVPYAVVVRTMDAARERRVDDEVWPLFERVTIAAEPEPP